MERVNVVFSTTKVRRGIGSFPDLYPLTFQYDDTYCLLVQITTTFDTYVPRMCQGCAKNVSFIGTFNFPCFVPNFVVFTLTSMSNNFTPTRVAFLDTCGRRCVRVGISRMAMGECCILHSSIKCMRGKNTFVQLPHVAIHKKASAT